ncbi:MAG: hypothetical protein ACHQ1D_00195 [Nitrososphaerales archaeon]
MYSEIEILSILESIIPELKKIESAERQKKKAEPVFNKTYPITTDYMERISYHAEIGKFPEKLFASRSPNQEEKEWKYNKENYKQVTLPVFIDYMSTITRPFHDSNWSIDYEPDADKFNEYPFQTYVESEIDIHGSVENYVKFILSQRKAVDANGIIAIKPHEIFTKQEGEELIVDPDKMTEPVPVYYSCKQIVSEIINKYYMVMLNDKSMVEYFGQKQKKGYKFEFYDDQNIWLIEQTGKFIDYTFNLSVYFNHEWNRVPATKLKGVPQIIENSIIWQSPFLYVTDILDLVALNSSNLQLSINNSCYPYRVMIGDVCEWKDMEGNECRDGKILDKDNHLRDCESCNGTGLRSRISPLGTMLLKPKTRLEDGDSAFTQKPLEYISPEVHTLEFLLKKISLDEEKARKILHIQTSNTVVKGSENLTATGMSLDMKALYAFVKTISDQTFSIWEFILEAIGFMRYGNDFKKPRFTYPTTFDFVTEEDIIAQLKAAVDGGLPPFVIHSIIYRYLQTLYFNDQTTANIFNLIVRTDRLLTLSNEQVALKVARGTVHDWEEILHTSAINFVNELIDENPKFLEQDLPIQKEQLIAKAKAIPCDSGECKIGEDPSGTEGVDNMVKDLTSTNAAITS